MCYKSAYHPRWGRHHHRHQARRYWKNKFTAWAYPPVNVEEFDDRYEILLYAAGYIKEDFLVGIKDDVLTITVEKDKSNAFEEQFYRKWASRPGNFRREFVLNEKIDKESIKAEYKEGILQISLPKLPGSETFRQDIDIV